MGADLIGYMAIGPVHLDSRKIKTAKKKLKEVLDAYQQLIQSCSGKESEDVWPDDVGDFMGADFTEGWKRTRVLQSLEIDCEYAPDVQTLEDVGITGADATIDEFVAFWHDPGYRDTAIFRSKCPKCSKPVQAVFAGDTTWGSEPDSEGFKIMKRAYMTGITKFLGISQ
jgi:hypothetical protein